MNKSHIQGFYTKHRRVRFFNAAKRQRFPDFNQDNYFPYGTSFPFKDISKYGFSSVKSNTISKKQNVFTKWCKA